MRVGILLGTLFVALTAIHAEEDVTVLLKKYSKRPFSTRIDAFSLYFSGRPFIKNPLGEGPSGDFDKNPLYRFDGFDCTTYIETVMALSLSKTKEDFEKHMRMIRYKDGRVSFTSRNHFPCADWIPNNIKNNYVADITEEIQSPVKVARALVSKRNWYQQSFEKNEIRNLGQQFPDQEVSLPYIPTAELLKCEVVSNEEKIRRQEEEKGIPEHKDLVDLRFKYLLKDCKTDEKILEKIPSGSILNMIREHYKVNGTELLVTHQGFVIHKKDGVYLRHVSYTGGEHVKDVRLGHYIILSQLIPSIKGIHLLKINPN